MWLAWAAHSFTLRWAGYCLQDVTDYKVYRLGGEAHETDWVKDLELTGAISRFKEDSVHRPLKVLVLYGSLRLTSYSRFLAFEFAR